MPRAMRIARVGSFSEEMVAGEQVLGRVSLGSQGREVEYLDIMS